MTRSNTKSKEPTRTLYVRVPDAVALDFKIEAFRRRTSVQALPLPLVMAAWRKMRKKQGQSNQQHREDSL